MRHEGVKILRIHRGQLRSGKDGAGGDHGVEAMTTFGGGEEEQLACKPCRRFVEGEDAATQNRAKGDLVVGMHRF